MGFEEPGSGLWRFRVYGFGSGGVGFRGLRFR